MTGMFLSGLLRMHGTAGRRTRRHAGLRRLSSRLTLCVTRVGLRARAIAYERVELIPVADLRLGVWMVIGERRVERKLRYRRLASEGRRRYLRRNVGGNGRRADGDKQSK